MDFIIQVFYEKSNPAHMITGLYLRDTAPVFPMDFSMDQENSFSIALIKSMLYHSMSFKSFVENPPALYQDFFAK